MFGRIVLGIQAIKAATQLLRPRNSFRVRLKHKGNTNALPDPMSSRENPNQARTVRASKKAFHQRWREIWDLKGGYQIQEANKS